MRAFINISRITVLVSTSMFSSVKVVMVDCNLSPLLTVTGELSGCTTCCIGVNNRAHMRQLLVAWTHISGFFEIGRNRFHICEYILSLVMIRLIAANALIEKHVETWLQGGTSVEILKQHLRTVPARRLWILSSLSINSFIKAGRYTLPGLRKLMCFDLFILSVWRSWKLSLVQTIQAPLSASNNRVAAQPSQLLLALSKVGKADRLQRIVRERAGKYWVAMYFQFRPCNDTAALRRLSYTTSSYQRCQFA